MSRRIVFPIAEARPPAAAVLAAQEMSEADLSPRLAALLDGAMREFETLAEPRAALEDLSVAAFRVVLDGEEQSPRESVIGHIYTRAEALRLFVATLGEPICARIGEHFRRNELAEGWMLDAVASAGADRLADRLAARFEDELAGRGRAGTRALPYSPGYCGWMTRGQRNLFASLRPEEIGVTLNDSCLMSPLKSVSGVLVGGPKEIHRFRPEYTYCDDCRSHVCGTRMARVLREA